MESTMKETKLVFNGGVCRKLLKMGCTIVDVKADKSNPDKTVFAFKNDENFQKAFAQVNEQIKQAKENVVSGDAL